MKSDNPGASPFEINYRAIIAMREIGERFTGLSNFCGFMNLPPPMNVKAFNDMQEKIASAYTYVADGSMKNAANEFIPAQVQGTVKWGDIIEQSYLFHGNLLSSVYNSHIASCLCFRLVTESFCSPLQKFSKCFHDL